jgi:hypothetical protein
MLFVKKEGQRMPVQSELAGCQIETYRYYKIFFIKTRAGKQEIMKSVDFSQKERKD